MSAIRAHVGMGAAAMTEILMTTTVLGTVLLALAVDVGALIGWLGRWRGWS